jgi:ABC-type Mn2+/Zn2+ transport system ATPase subunit
MNGRTGAGAGIIRFDNATLGYGRRVVLHGLAFSIEAGDFFGVVGPNGSGKTTLLRAILGASKPLAGRVDVRRGTRLGYVAQRQTLDPLVPVTVEQVVEMGRFGRLGISRRLHAKDQAAIEECLETAGIRHLHNELFGSLSGGQKQRALIARALASDPDVMLLDEPTNDLDVSGENTIMDLIHEIHHRRRITVIMVSHLLHVVLNHVERLMLIRDGAVDIHSIPDIVDSDLLTKLYERNVSVEIVDGRKVIVARRNHGTAG